MMMEVILTVYTTAQACEINFSILTSVAVTVLFIVD